MDDDDDDHRLHSSSACMAYAARPHPHHTGPKGGIQMDNASQPPRSMTSTTVAASDLSILVTPKAISLVSFPSILPPPSNVDRMNQILASVHGEYEREIDDGFQTFGIKTMAEDRSVVESSPILDVLFEQKNIEEQAWLTTDSEFHSFSVGTGNAGPDETFDHENIQNKNNRHFIYQTKHPIVSEKECDALIQEAKDILSNATIKTHSELQTCDEPQTMITNDALGEVRVSQSLPTRQWLQHVLHVRFFPMIAARFGIPVHDVTLQDGLIIGYGYQSVHGSRAQPIHRDSCLVSINVALSSTDDYTNGGTYFEGLQQSPSPTPHSYRGGTIHTERGHALCHMGGISHAGRSIGPRGERWVLVLFCVVRNVPEYARRCHAHGMTLSSSMEEAKLTYQAGLSYAPTDHLLLTSLGRIYMDQEEKNEIVARNCLALAAQGYSDCMKANLALGRMMLANRRPRAALRRFDRVLEWLHDRDILTAADGTSNDDVWEPYKSMGYDARYFGAQAALISAREAKRRWNSGDNVEHCTFDWRKHTQTAIERCHIALRSTPDDSRLHGMLKFAEDLLHG